MKIKYKLTKEEYLEAIKLHQKMGLKKIMIAIYIIVIVMIVGITTDYSSARGIFRNFGALFFGISFYLLLSKMLGEYYSKRVYDKSETLSEEVTLRVSAKGIRVGSNEKPILWDTFRKYKENENYVLLYTGIANFKIIPKSAMNTVELKEFMALLKKYINIRVVA